MSYNDYSSCYHAMDAVNRTGATCPPSANRSCPVVSNNYNASDGNEMETLLSPFSNKNNNKSVVRILAGESKVDNRRGALNYANNVLLVFRLQDMKEASRINFWLSILCLIYCAVNIVLLYINYVKMTSGNDEGNDSVVSDLVFHLLEFWATFAFAVVACLSLVTTPKSLTKVYGSNPLTLKVILFFNIVATAIPALLVTLNLEAFEIPSHEIEYCNEVTMTFVDLVLLWSLCGPYFFTNNNGNNNDDDDDDDDDPAESTGSSYMRQLVTTILAGVVAFLQLAVYNGMGRTEDGDMIGEGPAHMCEFAFEILSSLISFSFCWDNKVVAEKEIGLILYGMHRDCQICFSQSKEFSRAYAEERQRPESSSPMSDGTKVTTISSTTNGGASSYGAV